MWGEGGHKVCQKGEKLIFFARNNFLFDLKKKKKKLNFNIFDNKKFEISVYQARNAQIWVNFGQNGPFFNFPKKGKQSFFFDSRD